jgi:ferrous iron transport protein B
MGKAVEPFFEPLGWDWRISMAAIAAFPAREVLVSTLGTVFNLGEGADEGSTALRQSLLEARRETGGRAGEPLLGTAAALSVMVFFALCCQCGATVATIRRETGSWMWAWFAFSYMTCLAYAGAFLAFRAAVFLGGAP